MPDPSHATISEMMESYAAEAVRKGREFNVTFDYSESSLQALEPILTQIAARRPKPKDSEAASSDPADQALDADSRMWGAYLGETIRRLWGGDWGVETYPGTMAPVISVDIGGAKLFPVMKIYRRLTQGENENVWKFYQMVREKFSTPGSKQ